MRMALLTRAVRLAIRAIHEDDNFSVVGKCNS